MLHPDRYTTSGVVSKKSGVVVHDSESGDTSALSLKAALERPGDRDNGHGGVYGSGYSAITDGNGGYIEMATAAMGPYHAPPLNKTWYGICMPGFAAQTRDEWLDTVSYNHIKGVAKFIVDKAAIDKFKIKKLTVAELIQPGAQGYCAHKDVSDGWHQTDHYDPGPNFPWDILSQEIDKLLAPDPVDPKPPIDKEEEDMIKAIVRNSATKEVAAITIGPAGHTMTGVSVTDLPIIMRIYGVSTVEDITPDQWSDLLTKSLVSMGYGHIDGGQYKSF